LLARADASALFIRFRRKRKFVADGVFYAELNELLMRELVCCFAALLCLRLQR